MRVSTALGKAPGEFVGGFAPAAAVEPRGRTPVDVVRWQLVDEARRRRALPLPVNAPVGGKRDHRLPARPGQADVGEAAFLLQPGGAAVIQRPRVREQPFLPPGQEHGVELQPLGAVQRHQIDLVGDAGVVVFHHQADVLEELRQRLELLQRQDQFLEVFHPPRRVDGLGRPPHGAIAGFFQNPLGQLRMGKRA